MDETHQMTDLFQYATVQRDGFTVPLIGVPKSATEYECEGCGVKGPESALELTDGKFLCAKCRPETPRFTGCPPICQASNLPGFDSEASAGKWRAANCPSVDVEQSWECIKCGKWHFNTKRKEK